jgi:capsular polysaccharide biosynthesis protein
MDLLDSLRALSRRWVITLPLLLLTLGSVVAAYMVLPATYQSTASVVLLSSEIGSKEAGGNPYLAFDSSLSVTADVVARRMMDEGTVKEFQAQGFKSEYKIAISPESDRPILEVEVSGHNRSDTQRTLDAVVARIRPTLESIQSKTAFNARIRLSGVSKMTTPEETISDKLRLLIMLLASGIIVTVAVPLFVDSSISRRRAARRPAPPERSRELGRLVRSDGVDGADGLDGTTAAPRKSWTPSAEEEPWEPYLPPDVPRGAATPDPRS